MAERRHRGDPCPIGMRGIVPSLHTPFTDEDTVDRDSLRRLVELTVGAGCSGMLINAVAGETASLSPEEKRAVTDTVLAEAGGHLPVIVGVSSPDRDERLELARMAHDAGAEWMLCQPPADLKGTALVSYFEELCEHGPEQLMIQDLDWHGPGMALEDITRLFEEIPAFKALKIETVPAGPKYTEVLEATGYRLHVSGGWAVMQMIEALRRGVHAFIPSTMDTLYCRIYWLFMNGREAEARQLFEDLLPVLAWTHQHVHVSIAFAKRLRVREGVFTTAHVRAPVPALDAYQAEEAEALIPRVLAMQKRIAV